MAEQNGFDDLEAEVDAAIAACSGSPRAAIRAFLISQSFYEAQIELYEADIAQLTDGVSRGYSRGQLRTVRSARGEGRDAEPRCKLRPAP